MSLEHLVREWLRLDPNEKTRREVERLWDTQNIDELEKRMRTRIEFGTAGLRGRMEAGWARMNDLIIIQTSQGLCEYLLKNVADASSRGIVIGHDHRHNSENWARLTAAVFLYNKVKVFLLRGLVHTPLVPFSVKRLNAACGVMITASHNPKDDNGLKVYWENAVQIIGPHDTGIAKAILDNLEQRIQHAPDVYSSSLCRDPTDEMKESYFTLIHAMPSYLKCSDVLVLKPYIAVEEQQAPDPNFPTVRFPNPEEKGMECAISTAIRTGADYVLAQDPDSDRFSAAERGSDGSFTIFTGDQLGTLFASRVLARYKESGKPLDKLAMVASTVSSKMVEAMARHEGFIFVDCLTGFKFIGNTALDLERAGYEVLFGYEEAIGFMFGSEIRDKDGISATLMFAEMATELRSQGLTVQGYLKELYEKNSYFVCSDTVKIDKIFGGLRNFEKTLHPITKQYPHSIAQLTVFSVIDLTAGYGYDSTNPPTYAPRLPLSSGHMIQFRAHSADVNIVLTIRTSGTEPKIKYYLEGCGNDPEQVSAILPRVVERLANEWMKASENDLSHPN
ncbi:hypothetical protein L210DRAFT_3688468 [Boletus edulis BED1]|uniref:Phosphoglucomutase n=1 Tax=Boletus edulis BED1 TaxID=1328754 RepID=A0AAD4GCH9_BOLED|nr:hypothetical protein L210DRAFT_3688468 [Boletus edulis BED1]